MISVPDSGRLRFRLLEPPHDADLLLELDSDSEVMRFITEGKTSTMDEILADSMPRIAKYRNPEEGWGIWLTFLKSSGEFIGWVLVRPMGYFGDDRDDSDLELGWRFKKSAWGKGYATEAATAVLDRLIENGARKFSAIAVPDNTASIAVMKKIGMNFVRQGMYEDPIGCSEVVYYERELD